MNNIKVCHLTSNHIPKDGRIFYKECTSLAKAGYDVSLVVCGDIDEICNGVHIIGVPQTSKGRLKRMLISTRDVYKKAKSLNADIYHIHDSELLPYALKLKKLGKKVIFDSHEFMGEQILVKPYIPVFFRRILSKCYNYFETYICKKIDVVIEVCTIDGVDKFHNRCKKSIFITNSPIIEKGDIPSLNHSSNNKVVHLGGLTQSRGITHLAYAIKKTKGILVLVGTFSSKEYENEIKQICGNKLIYEGYVSFSKVPHLLKTCNIGVCTLLNSGQYNRIDTLPTKMYDYMLSGIPVIMSNFPYLKYFNEKYHVGICVNPDDQNEIASAINYLINNPEIAFQMGNNGLQTVLNEFNWTNEESKLLNLYSSLHSDFSFQG